MATDTFSVTASDDDGYVQGSDAAYPPIFDSADTTGISVITDRSWEGASYVVRLALLRFDTSALPDNAIVSAATLRLYIRSETTDGADNLNFVGEWYDPANWPISSGEYTTSDIGTDAFSVDIAVLTENADNDIALSNAAANVSLTGYTAFRLALSGAASTPTVNNEVTFEGFDRSTFNEPRLLVTYTVPAVTTSVVPYRMLMGVGT